MLKIITECSQGNSLTEKLASDFVSRIYQTYKYGLKCNLSHSHLQSSLFKRSLI